MKNKKINYFLIGVQKAGTSSFYNWLAQHPQIEAPAQMKDFHYFLHEKYISKGTDWLESFYSDPEIKPVLLKGATNYIYDLNVPEKIKNYNPKSKFILILRDPAKRAFSAYQYFKKLGAEKRTFEQAMQDELEDKFEPSKPKYHYSYIGHGFYYQQLSNWLKFFSRNNFIILFYEDIFKSPQKALHDTFVFFNVNSTFEPQLNTVNKTGKAKHMWVNNMIFANKKLHRFYKKILHIDKLIPLEKRILFLNWLRDWNTSTESETEKISLEAYSKLSVIYAEDRQNLAKLLLTDFEGLWKY